MKVAIRNRTQDFQSYRAARVKSLFNVDDGSKFELDAELDIDGDDWQIGVVVGPSGSGKSSIGRALRDEAGFEFTEDYSSLWPDDAPVIDAVGGESVDDATGALSAVGLGSVPSWLRPYPVLSMGEKFRCDLARLILDQPDRAIVDEFTSVVDRQIAQIGAFAFQKAWRRLKTKKVVLLTPHYDVLEWLMPDWVYDTGRGTFERPRGSLQRPDIQLDIWKVDWRYWPAFEPHHYLKLPKMPASSCYVGTVDGELVAHIAVSSIYVGTGVEARASRLVVMPEWQGAGVGFKFLNYVAQLQMDGGDGARMKDRRVTTLFHTSHPGLAAALRRSPLWRQTGAKLYGSNKASSQKSMRKAGNTVGTGYGGHFRAVQGFRYLGPNRPSQRKGD